MSPVATDLAERLAALPPATAAVATFCGWPLSDVSAGIMVIYGLMLIAWQLKTKWLAKWLAASGKPDES